MRVVLVRVSIAVKRHQDQDNSYKGKLSIEAVTYNCRGLVHCHQCGEHDGAQTDMVLET